MLELYRRNFCCPFPSQAYRRNGVSFVYCAVCRQNGSGNESTPPPLSLSLSVKCARHFSLRYLSSSLAAVKNMWYRSPKIIPSNWRCNKEFWIFLPVLCLLSWKFCKIFLQHLNFEYEKVGGRKTNKGQLFFFPKSWITTCFLLFSKLSNTKFLL